MLVATLMLAAGCAIGSDPGAVGESPSSSTEQPKAGDCRVALRTYQMKVDCLEPHSAETVFVASLTGALSSASEPPKATDEGLPVTFETCDQKAQEYLGVDWRSLPMRLGTEMPGPSDWDQGSRWIRCALHLVDLSTAELITFSGSFRRNLAELTLDCLTSDGASQPAIARADCREPHNLQLAGVTSLDASQPNPADDDWTAAEKACEPIVQKFVGLTRSQYDSGYRVTMAAFADKTWWQAGDRVVQCFLDLGATTMTGSAKGKGTRVPHYT
ncbi:septum formation family protein [Hamadaea sp. NPDC051192]|uniref:septum formation family protein n=1 Tax=Hamadaea sp. NPDC051192 TaxID=3154940 RepID=UPI00341FA317